MLRRSTPATLVIGFPLASPVAYGQTADAHDREMVQVSTVPDTVRNPFELNRSILRSLPPNVANPPADSNPASLVI